MIELFSLYKYGFLLVLLAGIVLTIQGAHLVTRKESLQVLALAQASLLGNIMGHLVSSHAHTVSIPLLSSFLLLVLLKWLFIKFAFKDETIFIVIYLFLLTFGYLLISAFPLLDSHMGLGFFGDIVSLSVFRSLVLLGVFLCLFVYHLLSYRQRIRQTLSKSILSHLKLNYVEEFSFACALVFSLFGLGLLFTVCFMIFPVVLLGKHFSTYKRSLIFMCILSGFAAVSGLALSLLTERISTVPGQISLLFLYLSIVKVCFLSASRLQKLRRHSKTTVPRSGGL